MNYSYCIELPPFEMILQIDSDDGINEYKKMIKEDSVKIDITACGRKNSMSDKELAERGHNIALNYLPPNNLIGSNGVKAEILENNQVKIIVNPFVFTFKPKSYLLMELEPQVMDLESLFQVNPDLSIKGSIISSKNLRCVIEKYTTIDYSSDEDPLPEVEFRDEKFFTRLFACTDIDYKDEIEEYKSIKNMREAWNSD